MNQQLIWYSKVDDSVPDWEIIWELADKMGNTIQWFFHDKERFENQFAEWWEHDKSKLDSVRVTCNIDTQNNIVHYASFFVQNVTRVQPSGPPKNVIIDNLTDLK